MQGVDSGRSGQSRLDRGSWLYPSSSLDPLESRVQILHLLRNQYTEGVLFQTSQKTQWGRGSRGWATIQRPRVPDKMNSKRGKRRALAPFDLKGK